MSLIEQALSFACEGETLQAVLSRPEQGDGDCGVLIIVGGPQYRAGSHRQFCLLARSLAAAGYATLRFDYRGMGDSTGAQRNFEQVDADIAAAISALMAERPEIKRVVLWGLCDAASAALLYLQRRADPRVAGLCLLNPWVRSSQSLAQARVKHYYRERLMQASFWRKLLSGKVAVQAVKGLLSNLREARRSAPSGDGIAMPFQEAMAVALERHPLPTLLLLSGQDLTAQEFRDHVSAQPRWQRLMARPGVQRQELTDADHTFSNAAARAWVERSCSEWLRAQFSP